MNIYVGNLSYNTDDEALRGEFEQFGTIESVNVIYDKFNGRSKGFGFIEMPNQAEAEAAIQELDGKEVDGRNLKVIEAAVAEKASMNATTGTFNQLRQISNRVTTPSRFLTGIGFFIPLTIKASMKVMKAYGTDTCNCLRR